MPGTKLLVLGMVIPPSIKIPCNGFIPYHRKTQAAHPRMPFLGVPNILPWSLGCSSTVFTSSCQPKKCQICMSQKVWKEFFSEFPTKQWGFQGIPKLPLCHSCCCKHVLNWLQIFVVNRTFRNVESLFVGTDCLTNIQHTWLNFESCFYITDGQKNL